MKIIKSRLVFILPIISIFILILFILLMTFYTTFQNKKNVQAISYSASSSFFSKKDYTSLDFIGKYVSALLPTDASIEEFNDVNGMGLSSNGVNYSGFTGFSIFLDGALVFTFKGVDGIGGNGVCDTIYKFNDTDSDYINKLVNGFIEIGKMSIPPETKEPSIIDLSTKNFYNISLFEKKGRRIGSTIYWKEDSNFDSSFNPLCGLKAYAINFVGPNFEVSKGLTKANESLYIVKITQNLSDEKLTKLDSIINSIKINVK